MKANVRIRLDMAAAAAAFCKANPDSNATTAAIANRLIELSTRATALLEQQRLGTAGTAAAVGDKAKLRAEITQDLKALMKISRQASHQHPDIGMHRRGPISIGGSTEFYTNAHAALTEASELKDILAQFGLTEQLLTSLGQNLEAFQATFQRKREGLGARVGAAAQLEAICHEVMGLVDSLDAVHAARFKGNAEQLAAWKSARNVPWPIATEVPPVAPTPVISASTTKPGEGTKAA